MNISYEPLSPDRRDDPYPVFSQLREHDPVHWAPEAGAYCISRYDDVVEVLRNASVNSSCPCSPRASLARLEAKIAMEALVPHLVGLRRASAHDEWVVHLSSTGASLELVAAERSICMRPAG